MHCPEEVNTPLLLLQVPPQVKVIMFQVPVVQPHPLIVAVDVVPAALGQYTQLAVVPPT